MNAHVPVPNTLPPTVADMFNLVLAIRDNLHSAGIGPFSDIPELGRAYSLARIAADIAEPLMRNAADGRRG